MEGYSRKDENCPKLLDLLRKENQKRVVKRENETIIDDENKLQLSLGPPGSVDFDYSAVKKNNNFSSPWLSSSSSSTYHRQEQHQKASFLELKSTPSSKNMSVITAKESSQACCDAAEKKGFLPTTTTTAVTNTAQKRTAPAPVVGWPPIRSFRKNIASSSTTNSSFKSVEASDQSNNKIISTKKIIENNNNIQKGQFVKINMDGIPIGRKVDLKAYDTYEKLSSAVDELFRGLLAAQNDSSSRGIIEKKEEKRIITGLLDGSGEYTLLYEDNEGDTMLVGNDVPWNMFVSTVKRLRVLKRSELPMLCRGAKHGKISLDSR